MDDIKDWYGPDMSTFGDRLTAAREAADMTQTELARRLGVRIATLRSWEDDLSEPRANRLSIMAGLLNVSIMWLINGQGEGLDPPSDNAPLAESVTEILREIRVVRADMMAQIEHLGRLEKKLRAALKDDRDDRAA